MPELGEIANPASVNLPSGKKSSRLFIGLLLLLLISILVFFFLKWSKEKQKVFAKPNVYRVELPKEIKKEDLPNLTDEQKNLLDNLIARSLSSQISKAPASPWIGHSAIVILTYNNQPILPTPGQGGITNLPTSVPPTSAPPTSVPPTGIPPTTVPSSPTPTLTPTLIPSPTPTSKPPVVENVGTIFVTRGTWNGNLGGLTGADSKCQSEAQSAGFSGGWISLLSDKGSYMKNRIPDTVYKNTLGQVIASSKADLFDASIQNPILYADGQNAGGLVWTGSDNMAKGDVYKGNGNAPRDTCDNWTCTLTNAGVPPPYCGSTSGYPFKLDDDWLTAYERGCDNSFQLYCIRTDTGGAGGVTSSLTPTPTHGPCTDSDNGFNVYVKGTVNQPGDPLSPHTDYCAEVDGVSYDRPYLFEYTCENNYWKMNTYNCPNDSCHDGVCTQGQPTPTPTVWCHDTDSGKDYYVYGTVTTSWGTTSDDRCQKMEAGGHYVDCSGEGCLLFERYCPDQHTLWTDVYQCPYACKNGACISPPAGTPTITPTPADRCTDSDGGKIFNIKGRTVPAPGYSSNEVGVDFCINSTKLNEYYCHEDKKHLASTEPTCPAGCYEGVCLNQNECTDSDGGQNFYIKGFVKPKPGYSQDQIGWDNCFSMDNKQMVQEYYCHPEGNLAQTYTECPNGCQDGACLSGPTPTVSIPPPVTRGAPAGFSVDGEAQNDYKNKYGGDLMADINKIYLNARKKFGLPILSKKIDFKISTIGGLPSYYNASTNEIVLPKGQAPSKEALTWLVAVSLREDLPKLPPKKLDQEIKKTPAEGIYQQVFEPEEKKVTLIPTSLPTPKPTTPPVGQPTIETKPTITTNVLKPTSKPVSSCADGWQEYKNAKFNFKIKYPEGWSKEPTYSEETDSLIAYLLVSTTKLEEQLDPAKRLSYINVVVSKNDLKSEGMYSRMFEDNVGNQVTSQIEYKGLKTEKYVNETPAGGGNHRSEMYYFKKGDLYYVLNLGIYTDTDIKEKNEKILSCFLENFEFLDAQSGIKTVETGKIPGDLIKCTSEIFNFKLNCSDLPAERVCGYTKMVFDNNESRLDIIDYRNACLYCSQFGQQDFSELRGTKFYMLGFQKGLCQ